MAKLQPNTKLIAKALSGPRATYTIEKHPGLYLATNGQGGGSWRIRYRVASGANQKWHVLTNDARNADFTEVVARAAELLGDLKLKGIDPRAKKLASKTVQECFDEWKRHTGRRRKRTLSPQTVYDYDRIFRLHLEPELGNTPLSQLTRQQIETTIAKVKAESDKRKGQRGLQATKALKLLSSVCEWATDRELIGRNPCRGVEPPAPEKNPNGKQSRPPTDAELRQLWNDGPLLMASDKARVLQLCLLLGRRVSEIAKINPSDLRLDDATPVLVIPADRQGNKSKREDLVPLPPMALEILKDVLACSKSPLMGIAARREAASVAMMKARRQWGWPGQVRLHDLRGLINDKLAELGVPSEVRSRVFQHTGDLQALVHTTYSTYDFVGEKLRALTLWEKRLQEIISDAKPSGLRW